MRSSVNPGKSLLKTHNEKDDKDVRQPEGPRRQRYSMDYQTYEAANIPSDERHRRMIEYMFPGYKAGKRLKLQEVVTQTDVSLMRDLTDDENEELKKHFIYEDSEARVPVEGMEYERKAKKSLAPHGWVGPPMLVRMRILDYLFIEITPVAEPPVILKLNRRAIDNNTLEMNVVPGEYSVPKLILTISGIQIYPSNNYDMTAANTVLAKRPSLNFNYGRDAKVIGGGEWKTRPAMSGEQKTYRIYDLFKFGAEDKTAPRRKLVELPESWIDMRNSEVTEGKEYRLNNYTKIQEEGKRSNEDINDRLETLFERDREPFAWPMRNVRQMKSQDVLKDPINFAKNFLHEQKQPGVVYKTAEETNLFKGDIKFKSKYRDKSPSNLSASPAWEDDDAGSYHSYEIEPWSSHERDDEDYYNEEVAPVRGRGKRGTFFVPKTLEADAEKPIEKLIPKEEAPEFDIMEDLQSLSLTRTEKEESVAFDDARAPKRTHSDSDDSSRMTGSVKLTPKSEQSPKTQPSPKQEPKVEPNDGTVYLKLASFSSDKADPDPKRLSFYAGFPVKKGQQNPLKKVGNKSFTKSLTEEKKTESPKTPQSESPPEEYTNPFMEIAEAKQAEYKASIDSQKNRIARYMSARGASPATPTPLSKKSIELKRLQEQVHEFDSKKLKPILGEKEESDTETYKTPTDFSESEEDSPDHKSKDKNLKDIKAKRPSRFSESSKSESNRIPLNQSLPTIPEEKREKEDKSEKEETREKVRKESRSESPERKGSQRSESVDTSRKSLKSVQSLSKESTPKEKTPVKDKEQKGKEFTPKESMARERTPTKERVSLKDRSSKDRFSSSYQRLSQTPGRQGKSTERSPSTSKIPQKKRTSLSDLMMEMQKELTPINEKLDGLKKEMSSLDKGRRTPIRTSDEMISRSSSASAKSKKKISMFDDTENLNAADELIKKLNASPYTSLTPDKKRTPSRHQLDKEKKKK